MKRFVFREGEGNSFSCVIAGDVCPEYAKTQELTANHSGSMTDSGIKSFIKSADLRIMQWEAAVVAREYPPAVKSGPNLCCPPECLNFGKSLDIDVMLLANNHVGDFGAEAVIETMEHVEKAGFLHVGAGRNLAEANRALCVEVGGLKTAVLNFAENEFGTAGEKSAGVAPLDTFGNIDAIREVKKGADIVIAAIHGGHEQYPFPTVRMRDLYRRFAEAGADIVWNCHTHCNEGYEIYHGVPIIYSPGNFFFPWLGAIPSWSTGYLTKFFCDRKGVYAMEIQPYRFSEELISVLDPREEEQFFDYLEKISRPVQSGETLKKYFEAWCTVSGVGYAGSMGRGDFSVWPPENWGDPALIRSFVPIRNLFTCESHNDLLRHTLRLIEENRMESAKALLPEVLALQSPEWNL